MEKHYELHSIEHIKQALEQLRLARQWNTVVEAAQCWLNSNETAPQILAELAFALANTGQLEQAESQAKQALRDSAGTSVLAIRALVLVALHVKHFDAAMQLARALFQLPVQLCSPKEAAQALMTLASVHNALDELDKAVKIALESIRVYPLATAHFLLATIYFRQNKYDETVAALKNGLASDPTLPQMWSLLAESYSRMNRLVEMVQTYEAAVIHHPDNGNLLASLGELYARLHRHSQAEDTLQKAVEKAPTLQNAWINFANLLYELNRLPECHAALKQAIEINPDRPELLFNLATMYLKSKDKRTEGLVLLQAAFRAKPQSLEIRFKFISECYKEGKVKEADKLLIETIEHSQKTSAFYDGLAEISFLRGLFDDSLKCRCSAIRAELDFLMEQSSLSLFGDGAHAPMDVYDASTVLLDACEFLKSLNVPYFLVGGTLLGILRDGELLPYDKDIDLGIPWDVDREWLMDQIEASNTFSLNGGVRPSADVAQWNLAFVRNGTLIGVDLFFFKPENENWLHGFESKPFPWLLKNIQRNITSLSYKGHELCIPEKPEEMMMEVYGPDWKTPDPYFDTVVSAFNLHEDSYFTAKHLGFDKLFSSLKERSWKKVIKYCMALKRFGPEPVLDDLANWLREKMPNEHSNK